MKFLKKIGVQEADHFGHDVVRTLLVLYILTAIVLACYFDKDSEEIDTADLGKFVKKNTILFNALEEMDYKTRKKYLRAMKPVLYDRPPFYRRYLRGLRTPLVAGFLAEYIVNGNTTKPINSIARTLVYGNIYTLFMLLS